MQQAVFTIITKNYLGLAGVLEASVKKHTNCDFFVFVADEADDVLMAALPAHVLFARKVLPVEPALWERMAFQYGLIEFCTAIKATCFRYLFESRNYEKAIYLDPDIYAFSSLQPVFEQLNGASMVLTPHIVHMQTPFTGDYPDHLFLVNGMFNLGFVALKNDAQAAAMLVWWEHRLFYECYFDNDRGTATDQKWMNFLPCFFEPGTLLICRNAGYNMAPWNFYERRVAQENGRFTISRRQAGNEEEPPVPLLFVHFSGYDYRGFLAGRVAHKKEDFNNYPDLEPVFEAYATALRSSRFAEFAGLPYSYGSFDNGVQVLLLNRRFYRRLTEDGRLFEQPFSTGAGSFYALLKKRRLLDFKTAAAPADKVSNKTIGGFDRKLGYVHFLLTFIKRMIGIRRYSMMVRMFKRYAREENHIFLLDKETGKKLQ